MRNFWLEGDIDGRKTKVTGGAKSRTGEMTLRIFQRHHGSSQCVALIKCYPDGDELTTSVEMLHEHKNMTHKSIR
jgi:hypothetical protein